MNLRLPHPPALFRILLVCNLLWTLFLAPVSAREKGESLKNVLVLTERGGQHGGFTEAALGWLAGFAEANQFKVTEINNTEKINEAYLSGYQVIIQLDYPPYGWTEEARIAFERYIDEGRGGWVGFHHASLLGEFDGYPMWDWYSRFMGKIRFQNYIAGTTDGAIRVERPDHPVMKGVSRTFVLPGDEWYTFDHSPRPNVQVLANVDESTYQPESKIKMGDHPAIWINHRVKARNVYFLMGHQAALLQNKDFTTLFGNAIRWASTPANWFPRFRALAFFNWDVEGAHQQFAEHGIKFFQDMTIGDSFVLDTTSNINDMNDEKLRTYQLVISFNDNPGHTPEQRAAFQRYMENGGGWMGFHAAAYNDRSTNWPWYVDFLGGAVFNRNNWPPMPAKLVVDDPKHPVAKAMPASFISPINEWYQWKPSPWERKNIKVLVTLSPENYPIGLKDIVPDGDLPVVWSNTDYRMIYLNMGHGNRIFNDPTQNHLIFNALKWVIATDKRGDAFNQ